MKKLRRIFSQAAAGLAVILLLSFLGMAFFQERRPDVPYVPTPQIVVDAMLSMAKVDGGDLLYDLGCGDGRIVVTAAKSFGCRGIGIDIDPQRIKECWENAKNMGVEDRVEFFQKDLFTTDFSQANVVTLYLLTEVNRRLRPKLLEELKPGSRIVSHDFDMGQWHPDNDVLIEDDWEIHSVYLWIVPANVTGQWSWSMPAGTGEKNFLLNVKQSFQYLSGEAFEDGEPRKISLLGTKIEGDTLEFMMDRGEGRSRERLIFKGRVQGHTLSGTVQTEGSDEVKTWMAKRDPATQTPLDTPIKEPLRIER